MQSEIQFIMDDNLRIVALTNIMAAQKVIKYNQQFLRPGELSSAEQHLAEIERDVQGQVSDTEEIIERLKNARERCKDFERGGYNSQIRERETALNAYKHCLRIITGEQKIFNEKVLL